MRQLAAFSYPIGRGLAKARPPGSISHMDAALSTSDRNAVRPRPLPRQRGRIRLRTIVFIRWIAVAGQLSTLLFVHFGMGYPLPLLWTLATVAAVFAIPALYLGLVYFRG